MKKHNEKLIDIPLKANQEEIIDLGRIYPLGKVELKKNIDVQISYDGEKYFAYQIENNTFDGFTARYLKLISDVDQTLSIYVGLGYIAYENEEMSKLFERGHGWSGADGIFSFNLDNQEDYNQKKDRTLLVFGDTFCGQNDGLKRVEPTAMVNNTLAYYQDGNIQFEIARSPLGAYESLIDPSLDMQKEGYIVNNIVRYHGDVKFKPYVTAMDFEKDVEIDFDLRGTHEIKKISIENFNDNPIEGTSSTKRGVKTIDIYASDEGEYTFIKRINLKEYSLDNKEEEFNLSFQAKKVKFVLPVKENTIGSVTSEDKLVGLNKVKFFDDNGQLYDCNVSSNSEFFPKITKTWYWLQDGIITNDKLYIYPCLVQEELNGIEGFEFKITGVASLEIPVENKELKYRESVMREAPLYRVKDGKEYMFPIAIHQEDNYAYFYGYCNYQAFFLRSLVVGRIELDKIDDLNNLRFFNGKEWVKDMTECQTLLDHVSCEMSVQKIISGENKGKYLAVFQYDTNGPMTAYAIGESVVGPFTTPRVIHVSEEVTSYNKGTTYAYNAKSHLHLSTGDNILVSYNVNDMSMMRNKENYTIYHPRFLNFKDTSND